MNYSIDWDGPGEMEMEDAELFRRACHDAKELRQERDLLLDALEALVAAYEDGQPHHVPLEIRRDAERLMFDAYLKSKAAIAKAKGEA